MKYFFGSSYSSTRFLQTSMCLNCHVYRNCANYCKDHSYCTKCIKFEPNYIIHCYCCEVTLQSACKNCFRVIVEENGKYQNPSCKFHHIYCLACLKSSKNSYDNEFCRECLKFYNQYSGPFCCFCQLSDNRCTQLCAKHFICTKCNENFLNYEMLKTYSQLLECKDCKSSITNIIYPQLASLSANRNEKMNDKKYINKVYTSGLNTHEAPKTYNNINYTEKSFSENSGVNGEYPSYELNQDHKNKFSVSEPNLPRMDNPISIMNNPASFLQLGHQNLIQANQASTKMCRLCKEAHILIECNHCLCLKKINEFFIIKFKMFIENLINNQIEWLNSQFFSIDCPEEHCYNSMILPFREVNQLAMQIANGYNLPSDFCNYYSLCFEGIIYKFAQCEVCKTTTGSILGNFCMNCRKNY